VTHVTASKPIKDIDSKKKVRERERDEMKGVGKKKGKDQKGQKKDIRRILLLKIPAPIVILCLPIFITKESYV